MTFSNEFFRVLVLVRSKSEGSSDCVMQIILQHGGLLRDINHCLCHPRCLLLHYALLQFGSVSVLHQLPVCTSQLVVSVMSLNVNRKLYYENSVDVQLRNEVELEN